MNLFGERKVPALLKAKVSAADNVTMTLSKGMKNGFMVKSEFDNELGAFTCKVFSSESAAKSYAKDQEIIKVNVAWQP